jgi:16S rRNA (guanine527-N7)-methyltransferase
VKHTELWAGIAGEAGTTLTAGQLETLERYRDWLESEAVIAGGIGPAESTRLAERHIGDSLLFLHALPAEGPVLDVGTGVGLPGIPLAIARPGVDFILLDRSERRVDLTRRAVRILNLPKVQVVRGDLRDWDGSVPAVVSRATMSPSDLLPMLQRLVDPGGLAILAGSWQSRPEFDQYEIREIGSKVLAQPVWILIMHRK